MIALALVAGIFAGTSACGLAVCLFLHRANRRTDAERMLWANKALVREGQSRIFPDSMIPNAAPPAQNASAPPFSITSPFRKGISELKESVETAKREQSGANLPDEIKHKIAISAMQAKGRAA